tara:strand:+ start:23 stop:196 length:174 start_codon:yes stop_codon:yes gene_type:complete
MKKKKDEEITVRVQSMFPNCQKYEPCCNESKKKPKGYKIKDGEIDEEVYDMIDEELI